MANDAEHHQRELARSVEAVREISGRPRPDGLESWALAAWFAEQFGALQFHAEVLAVEVERQLR